MGDKPVGYSSSQLRHVFIDATEVDGRWSDFRAWPWIEIGLQSAKWVVRPGDRERFAGLERVKTCSNSFDVVLHATNRVAPDGAVAIFNVLFDLGAETEFEAAPGDDG